MTVKPTASQPADSICCGDLLDQQDKLVLKAFTLC
jgi:hypothetical protein